MPFKSQAQRRKLYAELPEVAEKLEADTPPNAYLPERAARRPKTRSVSKATRRTSKAIKNARRR